MIYVLVMLYFDICVFLGEWIVEIDVVCSFGFDFYVVMLMFDVFCLFGCVGIILMCFGDYDVVEWMIFDYLCEYCVELFGVVVWKDFEVVFVSWLLYWFGLCGMVLDVVFNVCDKVVICCVFDVVLNVNLCYVVVSSEVEFIVVLKWIGVFVLFKLVGNLGSCGIFLVDVFVDFVEVYCVFCVYNLLEKGEMFSLYGDYVLFEE